MSAIVTLNHVRDAIAEASVEAVLFSVDESIPLRAREGVLEHVKADLREAEAFSTTVRDAYIAAKRAKATLQRVSRRHGR